MRLNYGILSTSSIAPRFIAAVRAGNAGNIIAVSSRTLEKAQQKAQEWGISKAYGDHIRLLEDPDINIVYISTVNAQHYPWAKAALEHGKHVICEKPCTTTAEQTRELFALARKKNLFLMEAEKMLFLPTIIEVAKRIAEGYLGDIYMAELSHSFSPAYNTWMFDANAGGGTLLSSGIYAVHLLQYLFGDFAHIGGVHSTFEDGVEWQYVLSGSTGNDVLFSIKNSTKAILDNTARIYGTKGWVEIPNYWKARKATFCLQGEAPETVEYPCEHELIYEAQHISECITSGLITSPVATETLSVNGILALEEVKKHWK